MIKILNDLFKDFPQKKLLKLYLICFCIGLLTLVLFMQLLSQLFTVNQFDKVTGRLLSQHIKKTGYVPNGHRGSKPVFSLVVNLSDGKLYTIDLTDRNWYISDHLHEGDLITIYNSTKLYRFLSLDFLDFGSRVSQVERNDRIILNFGDHKKEAWGLIGLLIIGILGFCYFLWDYYKNG